MNTQIIFKAEEDLKAKAMKKAQTEGVTLKAVLCHSLKLYTEGKLNFGLQISPEPEIEVIKPTKTIQKQMDKIAHILDKI